MSIDKKVLSDHGLSSNDYHLIKGILKRDPNLTELGMFSVLWSEHCSYKHSKHLLKNFPTTGKYVLQGPGENAGVVDLGEGLALCFKMESHNHPSQVEPYQGAATGVGGILRDIFTMGARPIAVLDSLKIGPLNLASNRHLLSGIVSGIAGYGNCIGVPTVGGEIFFADEYTESCLVNVMAAGVLQTSEYEVHELYGPMIRGKLGQAGNKVYYLGAATGRDGIHGATFASKELTEESESQRSSVQVGDPFMEKLLMEACLELIKSGAVVGMQDMGAAGLTSSSSEMASRSGLGINLYLDKVPLREKGMTPYELMLSESQERMLVIIKPGQESVAERVFQKWGLHAVEIGEVVEGDRLRCYMNSELVADVPARALADDAPTVQVPSQKPYYIDELKNYDLKSLPDIKLSDFKHILTQILNSPNIASKRWIFEQFDYQVQTNTECLPAEADAAVLRIKGYSGRIALSSDCNPRYCYLDPFLGAKLAVFEAARNLACVGAEPLAITDNLNFANPEKPEMFWQLEQACLGISEACIELGIPVISGNVSLYNETETGPIIPTPTIGMAGKILAHMPHITQKIKAADLNLVLIGSTFDELGGSEYLKLRFDLIAGPVPALDPSMEIKIQSLCRLGIEKSWAVAAHDLSEGGLMVALVEMITPEIGFDLNFEPTTSRLDSFYFGESASRIILAVPEEHLSALKQAALNQNIPLTHLGKTQTQNCQIRLKNEKVLDLSCLEMIDLYESSIPKWMQGS